MQPPFAPAYTPVLRRPPMPEARPHTIHATSPGDFIAEEASVNGIGIDSDDQATPRASLAGLSILAEAAERRISRDDTAVDISELVANGNINASASSQTLMQNPFNKWLNVDPFTQYSPYAYSQAGTGFIDPRVLSASAESDASTYHSKQARSLGRRFSRSYKEKVSEIRDTVSKHAPRMRRASTPHHAQEGVRDGAAVAAYHRLPSYSSGIAPPPLSPSKRNARYGDPRLKKFRSAFGVGGSADRKDTPAPPPFAVAQRSTPRSGAAATRQFPAYPWVQMPGGEGARKAAAMSRDRTLSFLAHDGEWAETPEELQARRGRVGSNNAAADSGADLSRIDDSSCKDSTVDLEDIGSLMEVDGEMPSQADPRRINFIEERVLPYEVCLQIFEYLDPKDLGRVRGLNSQWKHLADRKSVWRTNYMRKYGRRIYTDPPSIQIGGAGVGRPNKPRQRWEKMYRAREELERNWRRGPQEAGKAIYLSGHTDSVYCLQFDEEKIITGSRDRTIRIWDINTFQCVRVIGGPNAKPTLGPKLLRTVDYPSFHLATASVNGTAYGDSVFCSPQQWHDASILCLQYDDKILVTGSSDSDLLIWDMETYTPVRRLKNHTGGVLDVALDAKHIISCSKDSRIIVWDRETYKPRGELTGHRGPVNAIQLRGKLLVSASGDGIARLWDIEQLKLVKEFSAKERGLAAVEFSEDMKFVLAGGNDHITYKFNVATGEEVCQFTGHTQLVRSLWLDSANNRVVSGSYDLDLRVYDFESGNEIWRAEEWTTSWMLAAKSDYRRIVATSQDGRILVIDFGLKKGGQEDGQPIDNVNLLRGLENTNEVKFRDPWKPRSQQQDSDDDD